MKPLTPYQRLLSAARTFRSNALNPNRVILWTWGKEATVAGMVTDLHDLTVRAQTANALGFDMRLVYVEGGLRVEYVKRLSDIDYDVS